MPKTDLIPAQDTPRGEATTATKWNFEADYFVFCNCDWGCPCNFNAPPTYGNCEGASVWRITKGSFGSTKLDGLVFAVAQFFPGPIAQGHAIGRVYVDRKATAGQRAAIDQIGRGKAGGGIFELFAKLTSRFYPTMEADIRLKLDGPNARLEIGDVMAAESELLSYPDGTIIRPTLVLPHGIEYKEGLATNAKRWWIRDEEMLATYHNRYAAVARVRFTGSGLVG